jgi:hypothetical protein
MASPKPVAKPKLVKREPVIVGSAALTLVSTALYLAPAIGIKIPDKVVKLVTLALTLGGGFGLRNLVKPA